MAWYMDTSHKNDKPTIWHGIWTQATITINRPFGVVNESKQCMEGGLQGNLLSMEFRCLVLNSLNKRHPLGQTQYPLNVSIMCFFCKIRYKQY